MKKFRVNNFLPLLVVLFLAGLTLWLRQAVETPLRGALQAVPHDPDAIVDNFTLRTLGAPGTPQYTIMARHMLHYPDDDTTELTQPRYTRDDTDGTVVTVNADRGSYAHSDQEATFYGHVVVRQQSPAEPDLLAHTDYVQVFSAEDLIHTDHPITISQGESTLSGVGMDIRRKLRQFSLHAQVKGHYQPAPKK